MIHGKLANISKAIAEKKQLRFNYKSEGMRKVNPHVVYENHKGNTILDAFQVSGNSTSKLNNHWKQFNLDSITELHIQVDSFNIAEGFNSKSGRYIKAITKIKEVNENSNLDKTTDFH